MIQYILLKKVFRANTFLYNIHAVKPSYISDNESTAVYQAHIIVCINL